MEPGGGEVMRRGVAVLGRDRSEDEPLRGARRSPALPGSAAVVARDLHVAQQLEHGAVEGLGGGRVADAEAQVVERAGAVHSSWPYPNRAGQPPVWRKSTAALGPKLPERARAVSPAMALPV